MKRLLSIVTAMLVLACVYPARCLVIENESGHEVFRARVTPGEEISVRYIHSVELTPWIHYYEPSGNNELVLTRMRFKSFGAGVPDEAPIVRHVDGWIEYSGFNESYRQLHWHIRDDLEHYMSWRGQDIRLGTLVASGTNARIFVTLRPIILLLRKIRMEGRE